MAVTAEFAAGTKVRGAALNASSIPVVSATTDIATPFTGQTIFNTTDRMLYFYDGSSWVGYQAAGGNSAGTRHEARYNQTSIQAISNTTDTRMQFHTAQYTSNDVTASGTNNNSFLLNRGGLWRISAAMRMEAGTSGERHLFINTGTSLAVGSRIAGISTVVAIVYSLNVSTETVVAAGTSIEIGIYQSSGGTRSTDVGSGLTGHVSLTWLRPSS